MRKYLLTDQEFPDTISNIRSMIHEKIVPGCVFGYWDKKEPDSFWVHAEGSRRIFPSIQPMELDTIFDCASLTKVCVTTSLIAVLCDRSWISLDDPIHKFFPQAAKSEICIRHLLTHASGYPAWIPLFEEIGKKLGPMGRLSLDDRKRVAREIALAVEPERKVNEMVVYSDIGFWILGFIIEEAFQQPLDRAAKENIFLPLGMSNSSFRPVSYDKDTIKDEKCAATFESPIRGGVLQGQVDDDNCWAMGGVAGHAGMFAPIDDLVLFLKGMFCSPFVSPKTMEEFLAESVKINGVRRALGWDMPSMGSAQVCSTGSAFSVSSVGHLGFTGTSIWYDREAEIAAILLTNRVHPKREGPHVEVFRKKYRPLIHESFRSEYSKLRGLP